MADVAQTTPDGDGPEVEEPAPQWPLVLAVTGFLGVLAGGLALVARLPEACTGLHLDVGLAGTAERANAALAGCPELTAEAVRAAARWDSGFAVLYGVGLALVRLRTWPRAWQIALAKDRLLLVLALPAAAAAFDVVENLALMAVRGPQGQLTMPPWAAAIAFAAGVSKWLLAIASVLAVAAACWGWGWQRRWGPVSAIARRPKPPEAALNDAYPADGLAGPPSISLSGGGIRAASFALGALTALQEAGILPGARWLSTVSGGGYTGTAYATARGPEPEPGAESEVEPKAEVDLAKLREAIAPNQRFLSTGTGGRIGTVWSVLWRILAQIVFLLLLLYVVAWPVGALVDRLGPGLAEGCSYATGCEVVDGWHLLLPGALPALVAAVCFAFAAFTKGTTHDRWMRRLRVAAGITVAVAALVWGLPHAMAYGPRIEPFLTTPRADGGDAASGLPLLGLLASLGVTGAVIRFLVKPISARATRLGGVLLAVAAFLFGLTIAVDAAYGDGFFSPFLLPWAAALLVAALLVVNGPWMSLHRFYAAHLRSAFLHDPAGKEPTWTAYRATKAWRPGRGPDHLICSAAARRPESDTGLGAVSIVFSSDEVVLYDRTLNEHGKLDIDTCTVPMQAFERAAPRAMRTPIAAAAVSGAAVSSSMGRHHLGTTSALLAALNIRLGVWLPNPKHLRHEETRYPRRAGIGYLAKEILGIYDMDDPLLHVTDGGHWENLGVVELLRRRAPIIFCMDASGGPPTSNGSLVDALALGMVACDATVDFGDTLERLVPDPATGVAADCVAVGVIRYHRSSGHTPTAQCPPGQCPFGVLLYAKAVVSEHAAADVRAFALSDPLFPSYSTADQFLGNVQFDRLVSLGESTARRAVEVRARLQSLGLLEHRRPDRVRPAAFAELVRSAVLASPAAWNRRPSRERPAAQPQPSS
jgi:hypothetical protein